jgi:ADP-ribosylglycohydrolase
MIKISKDSFYDKVYGCWMGKSIGGTLGTPFEGKRELLNVTGFTSSPGRPLPNDDLDLQLVWLKALEDYGPLGVNEHVLGEYWINHIPPHWNEYGIAKSNMKAGLLPPLSGEYENDWKHSNGAWIRSEIWACCAPGCPEIATRYAWYDACVDHGAGEGTYAELFTASVESAAFVESDRDKLIDIGLSYIPKDCRVAKSIGIALKAYREGLDWKEARRLVLEDSADLGWFQAPANVAYFVIGWLYGEGDFKKSLLIAVCCGDDTDCTGATIGSILGIIYGAKALPEDWKKYVGDDIITKAVDLSSWGKFPLTCSSLTSRVINMTKQVLLAFEAPVNISSEETDLSSMEQHSLLPSQAYLEGLSRMNAALRFDFIHTQVEIDYTSGVNVSPGQEISLDITLRNMLRDARHVEITYLLPEGFELIEGKKHLSLFHKTSITPSERTYTVKLRAGSEIKAANRGVIQMVAAERPTVILIPLLFMGE